MRKKTVMPMRNRRPTMVTQPRSLDFRRPPMILMILNRNIKAPRINSPTISKIESLRRTRARDDTVMTPIEMSIRETEKIT